MAKFTTMKQGKKKHQVVLVVPGGTSGSVIIRPDLTKKQATTMAKSLNSTAAEKEPYPPKFEVKRKYLATIELQVEYSMTDDTIEDELAAWKEGIKMAVDSVTDNGKFVRKNINVKLLSEKEVPYKD